MSKRPEMRGRSALVRRLFGALLGLVATGCLRVDVSEGGRVDVTPAGVPCPVSPAAEEQPERIASACHLYTSSGIPAEVTLSATPDPGYTWTGWRGSLACGTDPVCTLSVLGPTRLEAVFEPVAQAHAFTPEAIHLGVDGVAYLTELTAATVHRYSLTKRRWLAPLAVPPEPRQRGGG